MSYNVNVTCTIAEQSEKRAFELIFKKTSQTKEDLNLQVLKGNIVIQGKLIQ